MAWQSIQMGLLISFYSLLRHFCLGNVHACKWACALGLPPTSAAGPISKAAPSGSRTGARDRGRAGTTEYGHGTGVGTGICRAGSAGSSTVCWRKLDPCSTCLMKRSVGCVSHQLQPSTAAARRPRNRQRCSLGSTRESRPDLEGQAVTE